MSEKLSAFDLLKELSGYEEMCKNAEQAAGPMKATEDQFRSLAGRASLRRIRNAFQAVVQSLEDHRFHLAKMADAIRQEQSLLAERLKSTDVQEADLDEILQRRDREKKKKPAPIPPSIWTTTTL